MHCHYRRINSMIGYTFFGYTWETRMKVRWMVTSSKVIQILLRNGELVRQFTTFMSEFRFLSFPWKWTEFLALHIAFPRCFVCSRQLLWAFWWRNRIHPSSVVGTMFIGWGGWGEGNDGETKGRKQAGRRRSEGWLPTRLEKVHVIQLSYRVAGRLVW